MKFLVWHVVNDVLFFPRLIDYGEKLQTKPVVSETTCLFTRELLQNIFLKLDKPTKPTLGCQCFYLKVLDSKLVLT